MSARAAVVLMAALTASCGAPLMKLPAGPGTPLSEADATATLASATASCRGLRTFTAEVGVSGSVGGRRMRGRLLAGLNDSASARLEAVAPFGQPVFIFTATDDDATLLLPRDRRVLAHAPARDVLEAIAGVPLSAGDLFTTMTGCPQAYSLAQGDARGNDWRVVRASGGTGWHTLYLQRAGGSQPWRLVAEVRDLAEWRVEYRDYQNDRPRSVHLSGTGSRSTGPASFNLTLALSQIEINAPLGPETFTIQIPADADPISLEELRQSGPLAPQSDGR